MDMIRADYRDMNDDEKVIAKSYRQTYRAPWVLVPAVALWLGNEKLAVFFGFACPRSDKRRRF
jgi:hypothetical protein